ncbi:UDP-N-acetylglucosamine 2-epimerase [Bacteroidetes bacterium UKL13-3]|nr:UDP-N-acetylglucosamine 2-epimerase [Bacteroidetes bacterium UKL13-3]HCP94220.1 UDP-N-acetylglucosamine 2-epimerase (non-hydrolyzing) [Bacteroidota bacterium]
MKKIVTIIGARPQFIKASVLSRMVLTAKWKDLFSEIIVHTGQHYDHGMSEVFFTEMGIPTPDYNLNIGGSTHGKMTGEMLIKIEEVLLSEKPDIVLVYGDTNSTLAGALAASKLDIPIAHIEAGLRSFWKKMPEEQNRVLTDHLSTWLFCPTQTAVENLLNEGIKEAHLVGDVMYDVSKKYSELVSQKDNNERGKLLNSIKFPEQLKDESFFLLTIHRAENTEDPAKLRDIFKGLSQIKMNGILPLHPRTLKKIEELNISIPSNISVINPVGYIEIVLLQMMSTFIITDSGGLQKEAYFMNKPCITLREQTEWVETMELGWNKLAGTNPDLIMQFAQSIELPEKHPDYYGDGKTVERILKILAS